MSPLETEYELKDGTIIEIKNLTENDFERNKNYEFYHSWRRQVDKYLRRKAKKDRVL